MKIYQLHECYGEYEDYTDNIIGSYLRKERAEEELAKAEAAEVERQKLSKKCEDCPFIDDAGFTSLKMLARYCDKADIKEEPYGTSCRNYTHSWYDYTYDLVEVEVEE